MSSPFYILKRKLIRLSGFLQLTFLKCTSTLILNFSNYEGEIIWQHVVTYGSYEYRTKSCIQKKYGAIHMVVTGSGLVWVVIITENSSVMDYCKDSLAVSGNLEVQI